MLIERRSREHGATYITCRAEVESVDTLPFYVLLTYISNIILNSDN